MDNLTIRKVNYTEARKLLQLSKQTFFDAFAAINKPKDMQIYSRQSFTLKKVQAELSEHYSFFFFAVLDNEIVGYLKLNSGPAQTEFHDDDALEVERIYVLAKHQGKKIGEKLLQFAINTAIQTSCNYIWLGVFEKNHNAIRFYQRHGFIVFSDHYFMLGTDRQIDVLMKKQLP